MKSCRIAVGGARRLHRAIRETEEASALWRELQDRYEPELSRAGILTRVILRWRMEREFRRKLAAQFPSQAALY